MNNSQLNFNDAFFITTIAMRINRSHPSIPRNLFWFFQFLIMLTISTTCLVFLSNSVIFYDIPARRYLEASKNGTIAILAITITLKYVFILYFQNSINRFIDIINRDYLSKDFAREEKDIIKKYSMKGASVSIYWFISATSTASIFPVKAILQMVAGYWKGDFQFVPMFDMRYPNKVDIDKDTPVIFCVLFLLCFTFGLYTITVYIGFDPLVPIFLLHICGQLDVLSMRMLKVFSENHETQVVNEKLKHINIKLQELYSMTSHIKKNYALLYEFNMKTTTFLLPLALFQVVEDLREHKFNVEFVSFFIAHILHFYMPCYYSDLLKDRSEIFRESIYSCGWEKHPDIRARKTILTMLTRTTAPLVLSTVFCPISLDTFAEMCHQSYAIFNIMNAALAFK